MERGLAAWPPASLHKPLLLIGVPSSPNLPQPLRAASRATSLLAGSSGALDSSPSLPAPPGLRRATSTNSSGGSGGDPSSSGGGGGMGRSGSLKRELGIPQLEAAQSLRRAMSCYPELQGGEAAGSAEGER